MVSIVCCRNLKKNSRELSKYLNLLNNSKKSGILHLSNIPPKKGFSGKVEYASRNIHDDFLEQLAKSTNELAQIKMIIPVNPRLKIVDGLYDKGNWVRDAITSKIGL